MEGEAKPNDGTEQLKPDAKQAKPKDISTQKDRDPDFLRAEQPGQLVSLTSNGFSGPIPPPEILRGYNTVLPNGADRVMKMAELEQEHRHAIENTIVQKESFEKRVGLSFAFIIALSALLVSGYLLVFTEKSAYGLAAFITPFVGLVWAFLGARNQGQNEDIDETEDKG